MAFLALTFYKRGHCGSGEDSGLRKELGAFT